MSQAPDSLDALDPLQEGSGSTDAEMEGKPKAVEGGIESPPKFDRVADVLGPLEKVVMAADQEIGTIQQRVSTEAGEMSAHAEKRIREASDEQRRRVAELRAELTDRVSELAIRFDAMLTVLDEVDRALAVQGGWSNGSTTERSGDVKVTVTERSRVEIAHEEPPAAKKEAKAPPAAKSKEAPTAETAATPQASVAPPGEKPAKAPKEKKGLRRLFRRSKSKSS